MRLTPLLWLALGGCSPATLDLSRGRGEDSPGLRTGYEITPTEAYESEQLRVAAAERLARAPQVVYVSFDGEKIVGCSNHCSDAATNRSWMLGQTRVVPAFDHTPYGRDRAAVVAEVLTRVRTLYTGVNVEFTTTRPTSGPYSMIVVGGDTSLMDAKTQVVSSSPADCGNRNRSDVGFVFANAFALGVDRLAVNLAHETGHTLGLAHVDKVGDIMNKYLQAQASFSPEALPVMAEEGACAGVSTQRAAEILRQNLGERLLPPDPADAVPAPRGDTDPPAVNVVFPGPNAAFPQYSEIDIVVDVEDASPLDVVELDWRYNASRKVATVSDGRRFVFRLLVGEGQREFRIVARDAAGNERLTSPSFLFFY